MRSLIAACFSLALAGCPRDADTVSVFFVDELVAAPARSVHLTAVRGPDCDALLSQPVEEASRQGELLFDRRVAYPVDPGLELLEGLPRGVPFALSAATLDSDEVVMARGCALVTLSAGKAVQVDIEMNSIPVCQAVPVTALDLAIVLDTSIDISVVNPSRAYLDFLDERILTALRLPEASLYSLYTHGQGNAVHLTVPATHSAAAVSAALDPLRAVSEGRPRIYDAMVLATKDLRARAVCGRRPVILAVLGAADVESKTPIEEVVLQLVGTRNDARDDLFTYGLGLSTSAYDDLAEMIPEGVGVPAGAMVETILFMRMNEAADAFRAMLVSSG